MEKFYLGNEERFNLTEGEAQELLTVLQDAKSAVVDLESRETEGVYYGGSHAEYAHVMLGTFSEEQGFVPCDKEKATHVATVASFDYSDDGQYCSAPEHHGDAVNLGAVAIYDDWSYGNGLERGNVIVVYPTTVAKVC